ncbi:MAG: YqjK-like family protein [Gallionellaceae bacterium]|nr:YqjK-like family protein [Gallionellaceae bacterium]
MNAKLIELAERRATLVARAATQRTELAQALAPWRKPLAAADQGMLIARYLANHPALLAGAVAFTALIRPRRVFGWLRRGWVMWRVVLAVKRRLTG